MAAADTFVWIRSQLSDSSRTLDAMGESCGKAILEAADLVIASVQAGGKVLWCGNGGSAAQAQHLSTEMIGGLRDHNRRPAASVALTTDSSLLTAWSNDMSFETVFSRQVAALGRPGDILIALSTSGRSANVLRAVEAAEAAGVCVIAFTGRKGLAQGKAKVVIPIPSDDTQRIQEGHLAAGHILCELVERALIDSK